MFPIRMRPGISPAHTSLSLHLGRSPGTQFMIALLSLLFLAQAPACSVLIVFLMRESSTLMALVQEPLLHIIMVPFSLALSQERKVQKPMPKRVLFRSEPVIVLDTVVLQKCWWRGKLCFYFV